MAIKRPRGTADVLPGEVEKWLALENLARRLSRTYGYVEIRTPIFEHTELFARSVGDATDIVEKEMYTFFDKGGRSITLRPEGTASVARAYIEHGMSSWPQPVKLYYVGPFFRHDRPQAGRLRQFHQFGVEVFGAAHPRADAEVIILAYEFFRALGLNGIEILLNSVGCPVCRAILLRRLKEFFQNRDEEVCTTCRARLERNPLRVLDCKDERCRELIRSAPTPVDTLCGECHRHFQQVQEYLGRQRVPYNVEPHLVRGLDYYTRTAFEFVAADLGAQNSVGGGGRYDGLVEACGGKPTPGVGFAIGLERTLLLMEKAGKDVGQQPAKPFVFVAIAGATDGEALSILYRLRQAGIVAETDYAGRNLRGQLKHAARLGACYVVIVGEEETARGKVILRDMKTGHQEEIEMDTLVQHLEINRR
ncbi:MAG: histidine--tRNA ligase [Desulfotomaculales bacterium]